eukprot:3038901-Alexandrium_andersonii.AAC.1
MVGIVVGADRRLRPKPSRCWRLYFATVELRRMRRVNRRLMTRYLGHVANHLLLFRPLLVVLGVLYDYLQLPDDEPVSLSPQARLELRVIQGLLFIVELNVGSEPAGVAFASDSSFKGYAFYETAIEGAE